MDMQKWLLDQIALRQKKALPLLSFPCTSLMQITVKELIADANLQAQGMEQVAKRVPSVASVSMMDLSVEAEAFGCLVHVSDHEVPTVTKAVVFSEEDADALVVPEVGAGRTRIYLDAISMAHERITDRPVFAGVIGPFSLCGRLMDVTEVMINCIEEPDMVHTVMQKTTAFLTAYAKEYKKRGANGIVMAEPLTGMLSPDLAKEFSAPYVKEIVDAVQDESFIVIYHNCGDNILRMTDSIASTGCAAYHFGNAVPVYEMLKAMPCDKPIMGNIDPAGQFMNGTPNSIKEVTLNVMKECCEEFPNFIISSGCDIPPETGWNNIDAFFEAVNTFYQHD